MESFRVLALLCLISGFSLGNINAQISPKMRYDLSNECTINSLCNWDTSFSQKNGLGLFRMTGLTLTWRDITEIPDSVFLSSTRNFNEFIRLSGKSSSMTSSGSSFAFNSKWERLTGKTLIDPARVYYFPSKRSDNSAFSNNQYYRTSASIFNMIVSAKYPYLNRPK